jgi:hypothetical protein
VIKACLALFPFLLAPGYVAGWICNLFEFRQRRPIFQFTVAIPLTIAVCPMLSYLLWRFLYPALWLFFIGAFAGLCFHFLRSCLLLRNTHLLSFFQRRPTKNVGIALAAMVSWVVLAILSLVDLQIGDRLYPSFTAYDHSVRVAFTAAILRHVPPNNPFFVNPSMPLRYHYLWQMLCAVPAKLFQLPPRYAVYAGIVFSGLGMICTIAITLKFLIHPPKEIARIALIAIGLLSVSGLVLVPTVWLGITQHLWGQMTWWNEVQITTWIDSLLWVPHHLAALIACMVGFLLLRHQADLHRAHSQYSSIFPAVIVAGFAFSGATGMSVYVTFTFVVAVVLWSSLLLVRKAWLELAMFASAGLIALLVSVPYLASLRSPGGGEGFAQLALRPFPLGIILVQRIGIPISSPLALTLANLILLPINYANELGFFFAVIAIRFYQFARGRIATSMNEIMAWTLVASSFLVGTFLRSSTISNNDLGWRCFLPAQLVLLLWGATMVNDWWFHSTCSAAQPISPAWTRAMLAILLVVGSLGTTYQLFMLRFFPVLVDRGILAGPSWVDPRSDFGKRAYALRSAYHAINAALPATDVVQANPNAASLMLHNLYSTHDSAAGDQGCGVAFGGDPDLCAQRLPDISSIFVFPDDSYVKPTCQQYGINVIVVENTDSVWSAPRSWVWTWHAIFANEYVRVFDCNSASGTVQE